MTPTDPTPDQPTDPVTTDAPKPTFTQPIVATPSRAFFVRRMIVAAVVVFGGLYLLYDGYVGWPELNRKIDAVQMEKNAAEERRADDATMADISKRAKQLGDKKTDLSILCQKLLGYPATILGIYLVARFLREGKGELRLADDTLYAPGHPPVPIHSITGVSNQKWENKGVALFDYRLPDGKAGRVKIDDFVFDRPPTDAIHDELLAKMPKQPS